MRKRIHAVTHRCGFRQPNTFNGQCIGLTYCRLISSPTFEKKQWWIIRVARKRLDVAMNARISIIWNRVIHVVCFVTHPWWKRASFFVTTIIRGQALVSKGRDNSLEIFFRGDRFFVLEGEISFKWLLQKNFQSLPRLESGGISIDFGFKISQRWGIFLL